MKHTKRFSTFAAVLAAAVCLMAFAGCSGNKNKTTSSSSSGSKSSSSSNSLQTLDFASVMTGFTKGAWKSNDWDRTNLVSADTTTTATIWAPRGESKSVIMLKGNSGTLNATSTSSGTLTTDPAKDSYFASVVLLKNGSPAQYGDGLYKFKMKLYAPQQGVWNNMVIFKDSTPYKLPSDDSVTKSLAIVTVGGDVQIQRNYKNTSGSLVKQEVVKDTGVKLTDGKYHYFILGMQDASTKTNVKLWIDGKAVYSGSVSGITGTGAIEAINNSTPMYNSSNQVLITSGVESGTYAPVTACTESYVGGYDDGPAVTDETLTSK